MLLSCLSQKRTIALILKKTGKDGKIRKEPLALYPQIQAQSSSRA